MKRRLTMLVRKWILVANEAILLTKMDLPSPN
jgi:hypothetical protein